MRQIAFSFDRSDPVPECLVPEVRQAVFDGGVKPAEAALRIGELGAHCRQPSGAVLAFGGLPFNQAGQEIADALLCQQPVGQLLRDKPVELVHRDRPALAGGFAILRGGGAGVIAVAAGLAGAQRHAAPAAGAGGDAGQQDRAGDGARRRRFRVAGMESRLDSVEGLSLNDWIDRHGDPVGVQLGGPCLPGKAVEVMLALVGLARQDLMERAYAPACAEPRAVAALIEPGRDRLNAHRPRCAVALLKQPEDQPHGLGLDRVDGQALLELGAALFGSDNGVAVRRFRAVPEALAGILLHRPQRVLGVFLRLILVEQRKDLPHHHAHRIVAQLLREADEANPGLAQAADMILEREMVAGEAAEGMDDNDIEGRPARGRHVEHALQLRPAVVGAAGAGLDEFDGDAPAARGAEGRRLTPLVRNRQVGFCLTAGRDAQVQGRAPWRGGLILSHRRRTGHVKGSRAPFLAQHISGACESAPPWPSFLSKPAALASSASRSAISGIRKASTASSSA